jgi:hypothetical protein
MVLLLVKLLSYFFQGSGYMGQKMHIYSLHHNTSELIFKIHFVYVMTVKICTIVYIQYVVLNFKYIFQASEDSVQKCLTLLNGTVA